MDPELPDWVVLAVDTNLNTRLAVSPSRTDTIADVRASIKVHHMNTFPDWGEVDVTAAEVDLPGGRCRLSDFFVVGRLFYREWFASLFAELTPSNAELWLTGVTEVKADPEGKNSDEHPIPQPPGIESRLEERDAPEVGCHQGTTSNVAGGACNDTNQRPPATDYKNLGPSPRCGNDLELPERQLTILSRKEEGDNIDGAGESQANDRVVAEVPDALTKKTLLDRGKGKVHEEPGILISKFTGKDSVPKSLNVVESRRKSSSTDGSGSRQHCDHLAVHHKVREVPNILIAKPSEKDVVDKSSGALDDLHESYAKDASFCRSQTGHAVAEKVHEGPDTVPSKSTEKDSGTKIPLVKESVKESEKVVPSKPTGLDSVVKSPLSKESEQKSSSTDGSDGSGHSGLSPTEKEREGPSMVKPAEKYNVGKSLFGGGSRSGSSGSDTSDRSSQSVPHTGSQQIRNIRDKQDGGFGASIPVKEVPTGGTQDTEEASKRGTLKTRRGFPNGLEARLCSSTTSEDNTGKSVGQCEDFREKAVELHGRNVESQGKDGYSNDGKILESNTRGRSKSYSSGGSSREKDCDEEKSEGDSSQQSSGEFGSESLGSSDTDNTNEMPPRVSRRTMDSGIPEDCAGPRRSNSPRSSDGLIDLRSSRDRIGKLAAVNQHELQVSPSQRQELQLVDELRASVAPGRLADESLSIDLVKHTHAGDSNGNVGSQDKSKLLTAAEPLETSVKEIVDDVGRASVRKDGVPAEQSQDGVDGGTFKSSFGPSSSAAKTGEVCEFVEGKPVTALGSISEAHATSENSQQVRAAVQLARMSMLERVDVDHDESSPYKKTLVREQEVSSVEPQGLIKVRQPAVDVVPMDQSVQFAHNGDVKKCGKSPVRSSLAKSLCEVFREACVEHGNVLTMPEATDDREAVKVLTDLLIKEHLDPSRGEVVSAQVSKGKSGGAGRGDIVKDKDGCGRLLETGSKLQVDANTKVSAKPPNITMEGTRPENLIELHSIQATLDRFFKGKGAKEKKRLLRDGSASSRQKHPRKMDEFSRQIYNVQEAKIHVGFDKNPVQAQTMQEEGIEGKGELLHLDEKCSIIEAEKLKSPENQKPSKPEISEVMEHVDGNKEKHANLEMPEKQSKPIVAMEMEQLDDPTALSREDGLAISRLRTEMKTPNELTLKKRQTKMRGLRLKPPPNDGNREGGEVQSVENVGHETGGLEQEEQVEILNGGKGNVWKPSRNRGMLEGDSLHDGDPILVSDTEKDASKHGESLRGDLDRNLRPGYQVTPAAAKKQTNPKKGDRKMSAKRTSSGRFDGKELKPEEAASCPYCGRIYSKKTSAYFRHKKVCLLGRIPKTRTEN